MWVFILLNVLMWISVLGYLTPTCMCINSSAVQQKYCASQELCTQFVFCCELFWFGTSHFSHIFNSGRIATRNFMPGLPLHDAIGVLNCGLLQAANVYQWLRMFQVIPSWIQHLFVDCSFLKSMCHRHNWIWKLIFSKFFIQYFVGKNAFTEGKFI